MYFLMSCGSDLLGPSCFHKFLLQINRFTSRTTQLVPILWALRSWAVGLGTWCEGWCLLLGTLPLRGSSARSGQPSEAWTCPPASPLGPSGA